MRQGTRPDIQRKKQAFYNNIRQQHMKQFFTSVREQFQKVQQQDQDINMQVTKLLQKLPQSSVVLVEKINDNFLVISRVLIKQISILCEKMVGLQLVEWTHILYIINRLLVSTAQKQQIETIIGHSLLPVLQGAQMLASKTKESLPYGQLMEIVLQYCYRLGGYVTRLNRIEEGALATILRRFWAVEWDRQHQFTLLTMCNNILTSQFDQDDYQNVTNQEHLDLELMKVGLITEVFYNKTEKEMGRMMSLMWVLVERGEGNQQLLVTYLRLLVNITLYLFQPCYYYPLLQYHVLHIISCIFYKRANYSSNVLMYAIRLLNNLLVNDVKLTSQILGELMFSKLVTMFQECKSVHVQMEIVQLMVNLLHFMNDDSELVRQLVNLGIGDVIFEGIGFGREVSEDGMLQMVSAILIMSMHHPMEVKRLVLGAERILKGTMDDYPACAGVVEQIFRGVHLEIEGEGAV